MNHKHTHPHPPTRQLVQQFFCTYFMLISKTVLHSLHGQFEIYDEYSDCCYGFPASKIYYAYCVGWGFLTSAQTAILGWIIPCWGGGRLFRALWNVQQHLRPSPLDSRSTSLPPLSVVTTRDGCSQCQMSPRAQSQPLWRTTRVGHEKGSGVPWHCCLGTSCLGRQNKNHHHRNPHNSNASRTQRRGQVKSCY